MGHRPVGLVDHAQGLLRSMMWIPFRWVKMYLFIRGFQRRVWCPKCTPASEGTSLSKVPLLVRAETLPPTLGTVPCKLPFKSPFKVGSDFDPKATIRTPYKRTNKNRVRLALPASGSIQGDGYAVEYITAPHTGQREKPGWWRLIPSPNSFDASKYQLVSTPLVPGCAAPWAQAGDRLSPSIKKCQP